MIAWLLGVMLTVAVVAWAVTVRAVWTIPHRGRRVIVNFVTGDDALEGLLWRRAGAWVVLRDARLLSANSGQHDQVDGEVLIEVDRILFLQVLPAVRGAPA